MRYLILFIFAFLYSCSSEKELPVCECYDQKFDANNNGEDGTPQFLFQELAPSYKCDKWGHGDTLYPITGTDYLHRFKTVCN